MEHLPNSYTIDHRTVAIKNTSATDRHLAASMCRNIFIHAKFRYNESSMGVPSAEWQQRRRGHPHTDSGPRRPPGHMHHNSSAFTWWMAGKPENFDGPNYVIRDGIVIIAKNGVIPHGTVI